MAITCVTQLDGLVMVEIGGKTTTCDMHVFDKKPSWTRKFCVWGEAGVMAEGKISKNKGTTMMSLNALIKKVTASECRVQPQHTSW